MKPEDPTALTPGAGFHLQADGTWAVEEVPREALDEAEFSGYLTIQGYRCTVFDTPGNDSWAQKSANTTVTASTLTGGRKMSSQISPLARRVAARWTRSQQTD